MSDDMTIPVLREQVETLTRDLAEARQHLADAREALASEQRRAVRLSAALERAEGVVAALPKCIKGYPRQQCGRLATRTDGSSPFCDEHAAGWGELPYAAEVRAYDAARAPDAGPTSGDPDARDAVLTIEPDLAAGPPEFVTLDAEPVRLDNGFRHVWPSAATDPGVPATPPCDSADGERGVTGKNRDRDGGGSRCRTCGGAGTVPYDGSPLTGFVGCPDCTPRPFAFAPAVPTVTYVPPLTRRDVEQMIDAFADRVGLGPAAKDDGDTRIARVEPVAWDEMTRAEVRREIGMALERVAVACEEYTVQYGGGSGPAALVKVPYDGLGHVIRQALRAGGKS